MKPFYKVENHEASDVDIPPELEGLEAESLIDLSWAPPELGLLGMAWWPAVDMTVEPVLGQVQTGEVTLTVNEIEKVVEYRMPARDWTASELKENLDLHVEGINTMVRAVLDRPTAFTTEYLRREAQARGYIAIVDSLDSGTPPPPAPRLIANFAKSAGLGEVEAARLTILQADDLYEKQDKLADLRMRKYEIARATSIQDALRIAAEIKAEIDAVAETLT